VEQSANLQLRILVVDDNVDAAEGLTGLLAAWGYTAHAVHDGAAALEAVASLSPDVVLLDLDLPKIHGYDVASRVRLTNDASRLMLVALTGFGQEQHRERTTEAGFDHHLVKPVDLSALRRLLSRNAMAKKIRWTDLAV
jgi:CheY-like chemotaxis protein